MAQVTSAMAAKYLRRLNEEHSALLHLEEKCDTFTVSTQEKVEDVRPEYDYATVQKQLQELEEKIRKIKHEINQFNLTQQVPGFDMTIDQMLIYIPQLTARKSKLSRMRSRLPKERVQGGMSRMTGIVEYEYCNYIGTMPIRAICRLPGTTRRRKTMQQSKALPAVKTFRPHENPECYENLANAIVVQAFKDYKCALWRLSQDPYDFVAASNKKKLDRFFDSNWYIVLQDFFTGYGWLCGEVVGERR